MRKKIIIGISIIIVLGIGICFGRYAQPSNKASTQTTVTTTPVTTTPVTTTDDSSTPVDSLIPSIDVYMTKNNITLKAKDVQFDMVNNLDKNFGIEGIASLGDYYNYGFTDNKNTFCIKVNTDNTETNSWYLYCDRNSFTELYNILKEKNSYIVATCNISKNEYKTGQGNMAEVTNIEYVK